MLREDASPGAPGEVVLLSLRQAKTQPWGSPSRSGMPWHASLGGVALRPRPRPGVGGPPFQRRNRLSRAGTSSRAPPTRGSGPFIGWICGDVVGFTDSTPSARRAGGIVLHPSFVQSSAHLALAASWRCNPERVSAAAAAAAMVSPVTVVSARAREPASPRPSPPGLGRGRGKPGRRVGRRKLLSSPGKRLLSRSFAPHSRSAPPPRAPRLPAGGRKTLCT